MRGKPPDLSAYSITDAETIARYAAGCSVCRRPNRRFEKDGTEYFAALALLEDGTNLCLACERAAEQEGN